MKVFRRHTKACVRQVIVLFLLVGLLPGCSQQPSNMVIHSGKGLRYAVDEIVANFEKEANVSIKIVYAGSQTLLDTIRKTRKGDVFIPGSESYVHEAGNLVTRSKFVAHHVPVVVVSAQKSKEISDFEDIFKPGVRIALGNERMSAIGRFSQEILESRLSGDTPNKNIVITASTVNELIQLVANDEVDAALVWKDMLYWDVAKGLTEVVVPASLYRPTKIMVSTLSTSLNPTLANRFLEYAASDEGKMIFQRHGFDK